MQFDEMVRTNRSYRRFQENAAVSLETLKELVDLARITASAGNLQPLRYVLSCEAAMNTRIFETLGWAAYLKDWKGPLLGERPAAYIVILGDKEVSSRIDCDHGIAAQTMLLGAVARGLGGCMLGALNRKQLQDVLELPGQYEIKLVLALGKPVETCVVEPLGPDGSIRYYRDGQDVHHVPKRGLEQIIVATHA